MSATTLTAVDGPHAGHTFTVSHPVKAGRLWFYHDHEPYHSVRVGDAWELRHGYPPPEEAP